MSRSIEKGATNQSTIVRFVDSSDGTPEEGVTSATAGLALWYRREGGTKTAITPSDLSALDDAHSDGGMLHIDDGYYRIDGPDAAFASGAAGVAFGGTATGMVVIASYHPLTEFEAIKAKTDLIGSGTITVVSPVSADGTTITLVQGDAYTGNRAISVTNADGTGWPADLTGYTIRMSLKMSNKSTTATGSIVKATTPNQQVKCELLEKHTELPAGNAGLWDFEALLDGNPWTLKRGTLVIKADAT